MTIKRVEKIGEATLYLGDCLSILDELRGGVDALVTDPPYGVSGGSGTMGKASGKTKYQATEWDDTPEYIAYVCAPAVRKSLEIVKRGLVTPGARNTFHYPFPYDIGALYQPATTGMTRWGRSTIQPVLFYGKDPRAGKTIQPIHLTLTDKSDDCGHPCPKPETAADWMVWRASLEGETVLDPFMGSGSIGISALKLGRKYIGIEIEERYFDIACERIRKSLSQGALFTDELQDQQ